MSIVYISSAFESLKEERAAVDKAIRKMRLETVAMEVYCASNHRPLSVCLEDVRACDIYIGIVAWQCGSFTEERPGKGFTELEYDQAAGADIPCLVFLS